MIIDTITQFLSVAGLTAIGGAFLVRALVKSGIEEAVKLNFSRHLEDYKSQLTRELEKLKSSLKNSESFFSHQLIALTELRRLFRHLVPRKTTPDMDWHEACDEIAHGFSSHADSIDEFLCKHEAVLTNDVIKLLEGAASTATDGIFEFTWDTTEGPNASDKAIKMAQELYDALRDAVAALQIAVDAQVDGRRT
jgi:hypothetical protein